MKIAVIGAGAIGSLAAGYLKLKGEDVSLVGHADAVKAIKAQGLQISGIRGDFKITIEAQERLGYTPDLVILATKTQDVEGALKDNLKFLRSALLLTTQNGIRADDIAAEYVSPANIIPSIVMFAATCFEPGKVTHNFEGAWIIGRQSAGNEAKASEISDVLNRIFPAILTDDIQGMKYLKIFVNSNNCIAGILGKSMQECFSDTDVSRISIAIWKEARTIVDKAGIRLSSLPDFPLERMTKLLSMPAGEAAKIFSGIMNSLSKEPFYGSVLQSLKRGKASEIDYINGEFVRLAKSSGEGAPLNERLTKMVHEVEETRKFFTREELLSAVKGLVD